MFIPLSIICWKILTTSYFNLFNNACIGVFINTHNISSVYLQSLEITRSMTILMSRASSIKETKSMMGSGEWMLCRSLNNTVHFVGNKPRGNHIIKVIFP
jgi:hypothetical protein